LQRASLNAITEDSLAGILRAALIGDAEAVSAFLDRGVPVNGRDAGGRTALMEAVFGCHPDTVELLLKRGAEVNAQDRDGWTALMEASAKGRADVVRRLLAYGADVRIKNKNGWTALRTTARCNTNVARLLKDAGAA
jgi:ankyrin repeat protein